MRVLHVQYTNPGAYPPLVRGAQLLAESGAEVRLLGTRVRGLDALDIVPTSRVSVRLMQEAADGWRLKAHYARYAAWATGEATRWKPDWIYASDVLSAPIAVAIAGLTSARVVYHEHDAPSRDHASWVINRCLDARRRLLHQADLVVAPNVERANRLSAIGGGRPVFTVWNCPRRPATRPPDRTNRDVLRIVFRGSVNSERLPLTVLEALARFRAEMALDIAGYETAGSRGYLSTVMSHAERLGLRERVRILGTVPEAQLGTICEHSDLGLALMPMQSADENMQHMTGASNKVFEYLSYGVAPLVSDLPDWRRTFVDPGYALACDPSDVDSIVAALGWAAAHRDAVQTVAARGWARLQSDWNYESQFAPVLDAMFAAVGCTATHTTPEVAACAS